MILTADDLRNTYSFTFSDASVAMYESLLATAEAECLSYADIEEGSVSEYFDRGGKRLTLTHTPIKSITAVTVNGEAVTYRYEERRKQIVLDESTDYEVKVDYECGWETAPDIIKAAIALTVQHLAKLQNSKQMGILSRSTEGGSEQIEQNIPPLAVKGLLDKYRGVIL